MEMIVKNSGHFKKGRIVPEEIRMKLSASARNRISNGFRLPSQAGAAPWNKGVSGVVCGKGRKFSDEHKKRISDGLKRNPPNKGWTYERWMNAFPKILASALRDAMNDNHSPYNNHSWKKLRRKVYERDGFICQKCLRACNVDSRISCHHIDFDRSNNSMDNLITLCGSCHGKTTQKPEEWVQYYQDKMLMKLKTSSDAERT